MFDPHLSDIITPEPRGVRGIHARKGGDPHLVRRLWKDLCGWFPCSAEFLLIVVIVLSCGLVAAFAHGAEAVGVRVKDADTIEVDVLNLGWGVALNNVSIRAANFDSWESSKRRQSVKVSSAEVVKGKLATEEFKVWIEGKTFTVEPVAEPHDRYGRLLGIWYVDGESVAEWMKEKGHVRE